MPARLLVPIAISSVAAALAVAGAFAHVEPQSGPSPRKGGTLRVALGFSIPAIDPALDRHPLEWLHASCSLLMGYPVKQPPSGYRVVPEAAATYPEVSRDGKTYTFTIRKGLRFHTGEPLRASNFAYAMNRILNPKMQSPFASDLKGVIVGAAAVAEGRRSAASGLLARGNKLTIRLTRPVHDLPARLATPALCPVRLGTPIDPEGVRAPFSGAGPYYIAAWSDRELVVRRNRYYGGSRPQRVDGFVVKTGENWDQIERGIRTGTFDLTRGIPQDARTQLARQYGVNRGQFLVRPAARLILLALNTEGRLFRNNAMLRRAINFAVDRRAVLRALGSYEGNTTDQYLPSVMPGFRNAHIYPLKRPDVRRARALAKGRTRSGKAIFYTRRLPPYIAAAQVVKQNLAKIGITVEIEAFPTPVMFQKVSTRGEPFDITMFGFGEPALTVDPSFFVSNLVDGRTIGKENSINLAYFNSRKYNGLITKASMRTKGARYAAFGNIDIDVAKNAAPYVAIAHGHVHFLVSKRVGCMVFNARAALDLSALCVKR